MTSESVLCERRGAALWITLCRPQAMNAITPDVVAGINAALDSAQDDPGIKAIVITGRGTAFCAGADLKFIRGKAAETSVAFTAFLQSVLAVMERLETFPRPVIAAVNGIALAGGLELVLCCDLVVAARSAKLGDAHVNYGLLPGGGASVRLPRKIGATRAKYLLYTGEFVAAEALLATGLINEVVDDGELVEAIDRIVGKLATKSSLVLGRLKALVDDGLEQPRATALRLELLAGQLHANSHDMKEGLAAFEQKRAPRFNGT
ncbi:MAG: enoyl-CoA hydratase/isomerase family protein [Hyphomonadaceae bacterium]|nr:enoyl-CoA hydratase/isomerase family protein [Hyphomonadaceae bacterium]